MFQTKGSVEIYSMGKKKNEEDQPGGEIGEGGIIKKHKKHKKHKHKKKRENELLLSSPEDPNKPSIKLKIKIGGQTVKSVPQTEVNEVASNQLTPGSLATGSARNISGSEEKLVPVASAEKVKGQAEKIKKDGEPSDEEEEWLKALEAGTLDDNGEVKKNKDPNLMTARQRALVFGTTEESLQQLPTGYKNEALTEKQIQRRQQKAAKRKQQAHEKREKDKKQTIERLLKKQDTKTRGSKGRGKKEIPRYRYVIGTNGASISVPQGFDFPFAPQKAKPPPDVKLCGRVGCGNIKRYNCSKTGVPLCSLKCYKLNMLTTAP